MADDPESSTAAGNLPSRQAGTPLQITIHPNPPSGPEGINDWVVPWSPAHDALYPDDWIVPAALARNAYHPDDWIFPTSAGSGAGLAQSSVTSTPAVAPSVAPRPLIFGPAAANNTFTPPSAPLPASASPLRLAPATTNNATSTAAPTQGAGWQGPVFPSDWPTIFDRYLSPDTAQLATAALRSAAARSSLAASPVPTASQWLPPSPGPAGSPARPLSNAPSASGKLGSDQIINGVSGGIVNMPPAQSAQPWYGRIAQELAGSSRAFAHLMDTPVAGSLDSLNCSDPDTCLALSQSGMPLTHLPPLTKGDLLTAASLLFGAPLEAGIAKAAVRLAPELIGPELNGLRLIGSFDPPAGMTFKTTTFGNYAHERAADILKLKHPDVNFRLRVLPGQRGIDVTVPQDKIAEVGFEHAEIKPLSASGEKTMMRQIDDWGLDPKKVRAITYDANGNVYYGIRR